MSVCRHELGVQPPPPPPDNSNPGQAGSVEKATNFGLTLNKETSRYKVQSMAVYWTSISCLVKIKIHHTYIYK